MLKCCIYIESFVDIVGKLLVMNVSYDDNGRCLLTNIHAQYLHYVALVPVNK